MQKWHSWLLYFSVTKTAFNLFRLFGLLLSWFDSFSTVTATDMFYSALLTIYHLTFFFNCYKYFDLQMFAAGWDDERPPPELNRWSAAHHNTQHTLANPKMILTFSQSSFSHCGWADNNFSASCVAAATQLRQLHTQLISWTSLTSCVCERYISG